MSFEFEFFCSEDFADESLGVIEGVQWVVVCLFHRLQPHQHLAILPGCGRNGGGYEDDDKDKKDRIHENGTNENDKKKN